MPDNTVYWYGYEPYTWNTVANACGWPEMSAANPQVTKATNTFTCTFSRYLDTGCYEVSADLSNATKVKGMFGSNPIGYLIPKHIYNSGVSLKAGITELTIPSDHENKVILLAYNNYQDHTLSFTCYGIWLE